MLYRAVVFSSFSCGARVVGGGKRGKKGKGGGEWPAGFERRGETETCRRFSSFFRVAGERKEKEGETRRTPPNIPRCREGRRSLSSFVGGARGKEKKGKKRRVMRVMGVQKGGGKKTLRLQLVPSSSLHMPRQRREKKNKRRGVHYP